MAVSIELASSLADEIVESRRKTIFDSYFEEVSRKTYKKYFGTGSSPYLTEGIHGVSWLDLDTNKKHYLMLKKRKWVKRRLPTGKFMPSKAHMMLDIHTAHTAMDETQKIPTPEGYDVIAQYETNPYKMKGTYSAKYGGGFDEAEVVKEGRINYAEKEILLAIKKWAISNSLTVKVNLEGEE